MHLSRKSSGTFTIAPTPFDAEGRVDTRSIDHMSDFYKEIGCTGITILGVMGEASKLEAQEAIQVARQVIQGAATLPIIVGVSSPGFAAMRTLARSVMDSGAAGVMIAPIPSLRTDEQIFTYFAQAVEAIGTDVPWVLQDYPLMLGVQMTPTIIRKIVQELNCRMQRAFCASADRQTF